MVLLTLLSVLVLSGWDFTTICKNHPANRRGTPRASSWWRNSRWQLLLRLFVEDASTTNGFGVMVFTKSVAQAADRLVVVVLAIVGSSNAVN